MPSVMIREGAGAMLTGVTAEGSGPGDESRAGARARSDGVKADRADDAGVRESGGGADDRVGDRVLEGCGRAGCGSAQVREAGRWERRRTGVLLLLDGDRKSVV